MRKYSIPFLVLMFIVIVLKFSMGTFSQKEINENNTLEYALMPPEYSTEELYQDIIITLINPYIYEAIYEYYGEKYMYDLFNVEVLEAERTSPYRGFSFKMKIHIKPFIGAHNTIGEDYVTIRIKPGETFVEKFEHIKSYPIPPHLQ